MGIRPRHLFLWSPESRSRRSILWHCRAANLSFAEDTVAHLGARIFVHAPQYHCHTSGTGGIDQEARERLVALEALVDRFGQQTKDREEVLASRVDAEGITSGLQGGLAPRMADPPCLPY